MCRRRALVVLVAALGATGCGSQERPARQGPAREDATAELAAIPEPDLENLEVVARELLRTRRRAFEEALAAGGTASAAAYGDLGRSYFAFGFRNAARACFENAVGLAPAEFRWRYFLGTLLAERGELDAAAGHLRQALELEPGDLPARLHLGRVELDRGHRQAARRIFEQVLAGRPSVAAAHYGIGRIALDEGDPAAAIASLSRVLELEPAASAAHHALGTAYRRMGDLERARQHLEQGGAERPRFEDPLLDDLASLVAGARVHLDQGRRAVEAGDLERAAAHFRKAGELDPHNAAAWHNLGSALGRLDRHAEALPHLERAAELDPRRRDLHFDRASALTALGRLKEAATAFETVLEIDPEDRLARYRLALVRNRLGDTQRSAVELEALVASDPDDLEARRLLATLWRETGRAAEAEAQYLEILAREPGDGQAIRGRARLRMDQGRWAGARRLLEESLTSSPDDATLHLLARLLATSPDPGVRDGPKALELSRAVFERHRDLEHAMTVAMAMAEAGNPEAAARWQSEVLEQARSGGLDAPGLAALEAHLALYRQGVAVRLAAGEI